MYRFKESRSLLYTSRFFFCSDVDHIYCCTLKDEINSYYTESLRLAEGSMPMLPVIIEASSDNISPKTLFVTIVSNCILRNDQTIVRIYTVPTLRH